MLLLWAVLSINTMLMFTIRASSREICVKSHQSPHPRVANSNLSSPEASTTCLDDYVLMR